MEEKEKISEILLAGLGTSAEAQRCANATTAIEVVVGDSFDDNWLDMLESFIKYAPAHAKEKLFYTSLTKPRGVKQ